MTDDKNNEIFRKLFYFFEKQIPVHFKDKDEIFYNGYIIDLSEEKNIIVLKERIKGTMPILLECIKSDSIRKMEARQ